MPLRVRHVTRANRLTGPMLVRRSGDPRADPVRAKTGSARAVTFSLDL
jgi:hypothetical protein